MPAHETAQQPHLLRAHHGAELRERAAHVQLGRVAVEFDEEAEARAAERQALDVVEVHAVRLERPEREGEVAGARAADVEGQRRAVARGGGAVEVLAQDHQALARAAPRDVR